MESEDIGIDRTSNPCSLRLLHCIPSLRGGGAERQLSYLSQTLARTGVDVHVAYHLHNNGGVKPLVEGVTFHELAARGNHDPFLLWQLIKVIRKVKPDLIQTWIVQMDILGGLAALITRTPFIMTERSVASAYSGFWKKNLREWIGGRASLVVTNSQGGKDYWSSKTRSELIKVVPNAVPVAEIKEIDAVRMENRALGENLEVVLFAGRFSPEKNLKMLLDGILLVLSERPNAIALLFGAGPLKRELVEQIGRHQMENRIQIMDYSEQLWGWMKIAKVFVSVSLFEGSPNAVCEAAAAGCPLVLSDIAQHRELFSPEAVFFVRHDNPREIANGILDALRDFEKATLKARCAYKVVSDFTKESIAKKYLCFYGVLANQRLRRHA
jgi:glycosyltransferase involved in cell wall biosynthesis